MTSRDSRQVGGTGLQKVTVDLRDADVRDVLRFLAEIGKKNIVAGGDVEGRVTLRLFNTPWDEALELIANSLGLHLDERGPVIRVMTTESLQKEREELDHSRRVEESLSPLENAYIGLNYQKARILGPLMAGAGNFASSSPGSPGSESRGFLSTRGSLFVDEHSNSLVVRDTPANLAAFREAIEHLDIQTPQILIEALIVEATSNLEQEIGVQWGGRSSFGLGGAGLSSGTDDIPFMVDFPAAVEAASGSALDLTIGSISGQRAFDLRLSALEEEGRARVISRPRLRTLNNVPATIKSLTVVRVKLPGTSTVVTTAESVPSATQSVATEKIETGIVLVVTPQVSSEGLILLDMFAKSSQADFSREVDGVPTETSREASSRVLVKDGETVVLGGIYRDNTGRSTDGVPFLKDIPGLGWFFKRQATTAQHEDLLIFLTPKILDHGDWRSDTPPS